MRNIVEDSELIKTQPEFQGDDRPEKPTRPGEKQLRAQPNAEASRQNAFDISFWLWYICLEFPARKVASASCLLWERKGLSLKAAGALALGTMLTPAFLIAWTTRLILYHISELLELISMYRGHMVMDGLRRGIDSWLILAIHRIGPPILSTKETPLVYQHQQGKKRP